MTRLPVFRRACDGRGGHRANRVVARACADDENGLMQLARVVS